jgi:hypothetical protein
MPDAVCPFFTPQRFVFSSLGLIYRWENGAGQASTVSKVFTICAFIYCSTFCTIISHSGPKYKSK